MGRSRNEALDPRESAGLLKAVPKLNLAHEQASYGSKDSFAEHIGVSRQTVNQWISGTGRMGNDSVIRVAERLNVSPLYVLGLCERDESAAPRATEGREFLTLNLKRLEEWRDTGQRPRIERVNDMILVHDWEDPHHPHHPHTIEELERALKAVSGDYRDLRTLAEDVARHSISDCPPERISELLTLIQNAGRIVTGGNVKGL